MGKRKIKGGEKMLGNLDQELGKQRFLELAKKCGELHNYQKGD